MAKVNPQTDTGDRSNMNDYVIHTIAPGETISGIAQLYGLKAETILWENEIANAGSIRAGQDLIIPPVNGVTHVVAKGETLDEIAKLYNVDREKIKAQNNLVASLQEKDEILIPGAKPLPKPEPIVIAEVVDANSDASKAANGTQKKSTAQAKAKTPAKAKTSPNVKASPEKPANGAMFIKPTKGTVTCGYTCYKGHYALDIADGGRKPPVWAAAAGKVITASSGTYAGGYGTHVIIDHGNGYKTLYAHMVAGSLKVKKGDYVEQGQEIGTMGNTGRVFGRTGIHTHFEIIKDGVKLNPSKYI